MNCPKCESTNLSPKGKRAGKQRYRCKDCGTCFTEGVEYKPAIRQDKPDITCISCGSTNVMRDGKLADGSQRYQCRDCKRNFSSKSIPRPKIRWKCPYCKGELHYSGYSKKGLPEYKCTNCGKSCTARKTGKTGKPIERLPFHEINSEVSCPCCNSTNLKKAGFSPNGTQRFICRDCNKAFNADTKIHPSKEELIKLIFKGHNLNKLSESSNYSIRYLREIAQPYYKKEIITLKQQQDIIKYGHYLKVPVNYMAEYIKCSEHMCRQVLMKYRKRLMSTSSHATS